RIGHVLQLELAVHDPLVQPAETPELALELARRLLLELFDEVDEPAIRRLRARHGERREVDVLKILDLGLEPLRRGTELGRRSARGCCGAGGRDVNGRERHDRDDHACHKDTEATHPSPPTCGDAANRTDRPTVREGVAATIRCSRWSYKPPSSSGLGRRPFKAVAGIRIPLGARAPARDRRASTAWSCGPVWLARRPVKAELAGSNPVRTAGGLHAQSAPGRVAQLAEHTPEKRGVDGSTPSPATIADQRQHAAAADDPGLRARAFATMPVRPRARSLPRPAPRTGESPTPGSAGGRRGSGWPRSFRLGPSG